MSVLHRSKDRAILISQHNDFVVPAPPKGGPLIVSSTFSFGGFSPRAARLEGFFLRT